MQPVYLDNNATTCIAPEVVEEMLPYINEVYGNPSSLHQLGAKAAAGLKTARERAAAFLNCRESEIVFTSCGTESNNAALRGVLETSPGKKHIVTSTVEHSAVFNYCKHLEKSGYRTTYLDVNRDGHLDLDALRDSLSDETAIVSLMTANNETGVLFPIEEIAEIVKERGIPFHTDAVQAAGKMPLDMSKVGVDLLSISGHKLHAPKGVGLLYIRRGTRIGPFIIGGTQERGKRAGTENTAYIAGLGKACDLAAEYLRSGVEKTRSLRNRFESRILSTIPNAVVNGSRDSRLINTSNISFDKVEGEAILLLMDEAAIYASAGSACTSGALEPSRVLKAMGVPTSLAHGSIRFSLGRYTTEAEIDYALEKLPAVIERLRNLSHREEKVGEN
jgi:cysteine desulfurase